MPNRYVSHIGSVPDNERADLDIGVDHDSVTIAGRCVHWQDVPELLAHINAACVTARSQWLEMTEESGQ
jgi:hypothetical protein